jgi:hypothetical protein
MRFAALLLCACLAPSISPAGALADIELYDRTDGTNLPIYRHRGKLYVAGEPRHQYEIRVRNSSGRRVLAVTSVDGVNVITGETAAEQQSGYVLGESESVSIEGWRKNLREVATFYFTSLGDSYAARTGRPDNVGVIGVALFRERVRERARCCDRFDESRDSSEAPAAAQEQSASAPRAERKLGTGHGHREDSAAQYVEFERASSTPDETIVIYYDSRRNLTAQGIVPRHRPAYGKHGPKPFPHGFVPDP